MVLVLVARLVFGAAARPGGPDRAAFEVRRVLQVKIESSWRNLTGTATVQVPGRWLFKENRLNLKDWVRRGDPIAVELGYGQALRPEFSGYVTDVKPGAPITLSCEDAMYLLKRRAVPANCSYAAVRLPALLRAICPAGTRIAALDADLGHFRAAGGVTVAKVLEKLREQYGFVSYYRDGTLYCGQVYRRGTDAPRSAFHFQKSGPGAVLTDQLEYRDRDDLHVIVEATSHLLKGKDLKVTVGDVTALDAEKRTLNYFDLKSETELRARAQADVAKLKVTGYKGSFVTYGVPGVRHGDIAALASTEYPERNGDFFIDAVAKTFDRGGYRQDITLGSAASLYGLEK